MCGAIALFSSTYLCRYLCFKKEKITLASSLSRLRRRTFCPVPDRCSREAARCKLPRCPANKRYLVPTRDWPAVVPPPESLAASTCLATQVLTLYLNQNVAAKDAQFVW